VPALLPVLPVVPAGVRVEQKVARPVALPTLLEIRRQTLVAEVGGLGMARVVLRDPQQRLHHVRVVDLDRQAARWRAPSRPG